MNTRRFSTLGFLAAVTLAMGLTPLPARAGSTVYVVGQGNEFGTINLATGAFTSIATLNLPSGDQIYGMGFSNGVLYAVDSQANANLWTINITNGNATDLGGIGYSAVDASTDAAGKMYLLSQDSSAKYYTLNPPSLTPTVVNGSTGIASDGLVAVNASGTQLFTTAPGIHSSEDLLSINPMTGASTDLGATGFYIINGLFVGNTLYGFDDNTNAIVTLNTTTGVGTQVATYSLPNGDAILASAVLPPAAVPEPSALVLGLIAAASVGSVRLCYKGVALSRRMGGSENPRKP